MIHKHKLHFKIPPNLVARALTGLVLASVVIFCLFKLTNEQLAWGSILLLGLAAWEWSGLLLFNKPWMRLIYVVTLLLAFWGANYLSVNLVLWVGSLWWVMAWGILMFHRALMPMLMQRRSLTSIIGALIGVLVLVPAWVGLLTIHAISPFYLLFLLLLVSGFDIGAYFAGSFWGSQKIMPAVSPGKSWAGLWGGTVFSLCILALGLSFSAGMRDHVPAFIALSVIVMILSVVGDLFESMLKRIAGVKDSGQLLPGHGGLLDRMDSLTSTLPVFALLMMLLGL